MLYHSAARLLFIRICILLLQYAPAFEVTLLVLSAALHLPSFCSIALVSLLLAETSFAIFIYAPHRARLHQLAKHPPPLTHKERAELFQKCIANIPQWDRYLQLWFLGADLNDIRRENVCDFILWGFFDRDGEAETDADQNELEDFLDQTEMSLGRRLPAGRGSAIPLRLTIDAVPIRYHSVIWYAIVGIVDMFTHQMLRFRRFAYHHPPLTLIKKFTHSFPPTAALRAPHRLSPSSIAYWYRPHRSTKHLPVVFLHGIGIGLFPYLPFLSALSEIDNGQIGILALELPPISARLTSPPLSRPEFLSELTAILAAHPEWDRFVLISHSYGSVLTTHILRSELGNRVDAVILVDPVTLLLHLPDVAYNFTRRQPTRANEWQLWYFATMDVGVAGVLGRYFFWRENIIWREELMGGDKKRKAAVCLAGRDLIADTKTVARYLSTEGDFADVSDEDVFDVAKDQDFTGPTGVQMLWFAELDHSQVFEQKQHWSRIVDVVRRYSTREASS